MVVLAEFLWFRIETYHFQLLDVIQRAKEGHVHSQTVLARYSSLVAVKREKAYWLFLGHKEMVCQRSEILS